jgi:hypothetical protein
MSRGHLHLEVLWDGKAVTGVNIRNTRPAAFRLLVGRTPAEARTTIPLLFSACRHGQGAAARLALSAAEGSEDRVNGSALAAESAQEHLWRLLLDWPEFLGLTPARETFAAWHRRLAAVAIRGGWGETGPEFARFCDRELLDRDVAEWLAAEEGQTGDASLCGKIVAALDKDAEMRCATVTFLPVGLQARSYHEAMAVDLNAGFARTPTWQKAAAETGPYARWWQTRPVAAKSSAIVARVLARMADLAFLALEAAGRLPARWRCDAFSPVPGTGFAVVETARGLLIHHVRVSRGRIADYLIVAPTEWNFHPAGAFRHGLLGLRSEDMGMIEKRARRLALALDPCVPFEVNVKFAAHA